MRAGQDSNLRPRDEKSDSAEADSISLQLIRKVVARLRRRGLAAPLSTVRFGVFESLDEGGRRLAGDVVMQLDDGTWRAHVGRAGSCLSSRFR